MRLVVISSPVPIADEAKIINSLFEAGLKYFHLRKPVDEDVSGLLKDIDSVYYPFIALHQHHHLATEFGIKNLHFTEQLRRETSESKLQMHLDQGYRLSTSVHDTALLAGLSHFDYAFYGPVFNSLSKPGYQGVVSKDFKLGQSVGLSVIALGGITKSNLGVVREMRFDGAAVIGAIWNHPSRALENFKLLSNTIKNEHR